MKQKNITSALKYIDSDKMIGRNVDRRGFYIRNILKIFSFNTGGKFFLMKMKDR